MNISMSGLPQVLFLTFVVLGIIGLTLKQYLLPKDHPSSSDPSSSVFAGIVKWNQSFLTVFSWGSFVLAILTVILFGERSS
jgi:hypothetical protein